MSLIKKLKALIRRPKKDALEVAPRSSDATNYQIRPDDITHDGYVNLDRLPSEWDFQTKLEAAIQYFNMRKAWGVIGASWSSGPGTLYRPVVLQGYFQLNANFASKDFRQKPAIYITINDPEAYAFTCVAKKDNGISYAAGQMFEKALLELTSDANIKAVIHTRNSVDQWFNRISIGNRGGQMQYGIHVGGYSNQAGRAINTYMEGCTIRGAKVAAVFYDNVGNNHYVERCGFMQCGTGIKAHGIGSLFVRGKQIETNANELGNAPGLHIERAQRVSITDMYFEEGSSYFRDVLQFYMHMSKITNVTMTIDKGCGGFFFNMNRWDAFHFNFDPEDYPSFKFEQNHTHNRKFYDELIERYPASDNPEMFKFWGNMIKPVRFPPEE